MRHALSISAVWMVLSVAVGGCDRGPAHYPVAGSVTLDGQPVPSGEVIFVPADGSPPDAGPIVDGRFSFPSVAGNMRVEITAVKDHPTMKVVGGTPNTWLPAKVNYIPDRYRGAASELSIDVPRGGKSDIQFDLVTAP